MADPSTYNSTTEPNPDPQSFWQRIQITPSHLYMKIGQLLLSFVAFICEEFIDSCNTCGGLYFFEFVSCSAVLISILFIIVYCFDLLKSNIPSFKKIDFFITVIVGILLLLSSIAFVSTIESSPLSIASVVFGFFASSAFLVEGYLMWKDDYLKQEKKQANGENGQHETKPLNQNNPNNAENE